MASACVNNIGISPEFPSYGWMKKPQPQPEKPLSTPSEKSEEADLGEDFEFRLEENFTMLPADELFFDGKLVPLQLSMLKPVVSSSEPPTSRVTSPQTAKPLRNEISIMDPYLFSPKAPRCTTRWKELLGLRKLYQRENEKEKEIIHKSNLSSLASTKSLKNLLNRSSKSSMSASLDGSVSLPLLKDSDNEYTSITTSSRLSLSSSSSSHEHDELPRLSLDADNNKHGSLNLPRVSVGNHHRGARVAHAHPRRSTTSSENSNGGVRGSRNAMRRQADTNQEARVISADSPRMNASGKIVYNSLERSSSSPSSYGGPRYKHSSVQRSYSANVRVTPVLNVPVCSLRGGGGGGGVFGLFGSTTQPKRDSFGSINGSSSCSSKVSCNSQSSKHRKDRI